MGLTKIEWCHYTFNPWWGCTRVSEACRNCYAASIAWRMSKLEWGREWRFFGEQRWSDPHRWQQRAETQGVRYRVFCESMGDIFQKKVPSNDVAQKLDVARIQLWKTIELTPGLDWILLTKRPQEIEHTVPREWLSSWPVNVWLGTTVEDQSVASSRIEPLLAVAPGQRILRFVSCEPLLGRLDLSAWIGTERVTPGKVNWIIAGGESQPRARASHPDWLSALKNQAAKAHVPFFFKSWGAYCPEDLSTEENPSRRTVVESQGHRVTMVMSLGKKAPAVLEGKSWTQIPNGDGAVPSQQLALPVEVR